MEKGSGKIKRERMKGLVIRILEDLICVQRNRMEFEQLTLRNIWCLITRSQKGNVTINRWKLTIEILYQQGKENEMNTLSNEAD